MISPDLLHQLIKGTFKDHLVKWVCKYLEAEHGEHRAGIILDDIDRRWVFLTTPGGRIIRLTTNLNLGIALQPYHPSQAFADFPKVGASSNGLGTTLRH